MSFLCSELEPTLPNLDQFQVGQISKLLYSLNVCRPCTEVVIYVMNELKDGQKRFTITRLSTMNQFLFEDFYYLFTHNLSPSWSLGDVTVASLAATAAAGPLDACVK